MFKKSFQHRLFPVALSSCALQQRLVCLDFRTGKAMEKYAQATLQDEHEHGVQNIYDTGDQDPEGAGQEGELVTNEQLREAEKVANEAGIGFNLLVGVVGINMAVIILLTLGSGVPPAKADLHGVSKGALVHKLQDLVNEGEQAKSELRELNRSDQAIDQNLARIHENLERMTRELVAICQKIYSKLVAKNYSLDKIRSFFKVYLARYFAQVPADIAAKYTAKVLAALNL